jgi:cellulose synthase/poly-beta-1,6-N-acetylglucosamine synthase-like glycosyltransferase
MIVETTILIGSILFLFYAGYFLLTWTRSRRRNPSNDPSSWNYAPFVSVILPTYNEEDTIIHKLKNLMEQDYPNMEIIAIDGASKDRTVSLIERFGRDNGLRMKLIKEKERKGKASAINEALQHCSGEIVVITDADALWEKDALREALSNFADPKIGAVTGRQILLNPAQNWVTKAEKTYRDFYQVLRLGESAIDSTPIFHGELSCFRRSLIDAVSTDSMADDSELAIKVRKKGFRAVYDANAIFYEYAPPSLKSRYVQKIRRGQGLVQLFFRERKICLNPKYGNFGTIVFPSEFFMHVISPILVATLLVFSLFSFIFLNLENFLGLTVAATALFVIPAFKGIDTLSCLLSFLNSQLALFMSLIYFVAGKSQSKWKKVDEVRRLWQTKK